jgi:N-acetylneuraminic acid mutarotase
MAASDSEVLMVFGGVDEKRYFLTSLLIFNPRSNCWMELTTKLPRGCAGLQAFYDSGSRSVYLVGGDTDLDTTQGAKKITTSKCHP